MKVCPVCNETFPEELKFCDLDGARLNRDGASAAQAQGKLWSILGVGIVFGSLVIIAMAIFLSPGTPAPISSFAPVTPPSSESKPALADATSTYQPDVVEEDVSAAELKKKEKPPGSSNSNTSMSPLDPKAASHTSEDKSDSKAINEEHKEAAQPELKAEPVTTPKTVKTSAESPDPKEASKTAQPASESKKELKSSKDSKDKDSDKSSADKKKTDNKEKKKGGFLNVFRKVFGGKKDDKDKKN